MIGREREIEELGAVAALRTCTNERGERIAEEPASLVIVYGGASTGKSACVAQALQRHAELYAMVDCTAIYSAQEFYREILVQLYKNLRASSTQSSQSYHQQQQMEARDVDPSDELTIDDDAEPDDAASDARGSDNSDNDSNDDANGNSSDDNTSGALTAVTRAKRLHAQHQQRQTQLERETRSHRVSYEGYNALNFLSFIKALGQFIDAATAAGASSHTNRDAPPHKRVIHLALDEADRLLDRGLAPLLTCLFTVNDQLAYLNMFTDATWDVSVLLVTRAMSLEFDRLVDAFFPSFIAFPPYTSGQVADILVEQLRMHAVARIFRRWLVHLSTLVPASQGDWLEFRRTVVHLLPDFRAFFAVVRGDEDDDRSHAAVTPATTKANHQLVKKLTSLTNERVSAFEQTRRKHLFGHDKLQRSGTNRDPTAGVACTDLSRSCLLLVVAGFLASFNPQDTDTNFLSSAGGLRRKKRIKRTATTKQSSSARHRISQLLVGPRIFTLQRLLAIYLNLRVEASAELADEVAGTEAREDIFTHLATLVRMQLLQRTSPPQMLDDIKFRCLADSRFVHETSELLRFPLDSYLNTTT